MPVEKLNAAKKNVYNKIAGLPWMLRFLVHLLLIVIKFAFGIFIVWCGVSSPLDPLLKIIILAIYIPYLWLMRWNSFDRSKEQLFSRLNSKVEKLEE